MTEPTDEDLVHARTLWDYHRLDEKSRPSDVIIGLGSHDSSVAEQAARPRRTGLAPAILFSGANAQTTIDRFPRGETVRYAEQAIVLGVPQSAILLEKRGTNTGENVEFARQVLTDSKIATKSAEIVTRPYRQRRARATLRKIWPMLATRFTAKPASFCEYMREIGDANRAIDMLVGDTKRIWPYAHRGLAAEEPLSKTVLEAFTRLVLAGNVHRLAA